MLINVMAELVLGSQLYRMFQIQSSVRTHGLLENHIPGLLEQIGGQQQ